MKKISASKIVSGYTLVQDAQSLARMTEILRGAVRAGVDTEADSLHHYFEKVCLIQLSFSGANYIIDPLAGFSLSEFFEVLAEKELIFQGADYDLRLLKKSFGFRPRTRIFDTMLAAQILGYDKIGLAALVERFFGEVMPKAGQKADWSERPLRPGLLTYASDDTKYLEAIADAMAESLEKLNRTAWHRECCERVVKATWLPDKEDSREAWRIKGCHAMTPRELAFVRGLWLWRDQEARKRDRPVFYILKNEDLIELARWRAKHPGAPFAQGPSWLKRFSGENLARLDEALRTAAGVCPEERPLPRKIKPRTGALPHQQKLEPLLAACRKIAEELKIEPSLLASRAAITALIRNPPRSVDEAMEASGMMRWQAERVMDAVKAVFGKDS